MKISELRIVPAMTPASKPNAVPIEIGTTIVLAKMKNSHCKEPNAVVQTDETFLSTISPDCLRHEIIKLRRLSIPLARTTPPAAHTARPLRTSAFHHSRRILRNAAALRAASLQPVGDTHQKPGDQQKTRAGQKRGVRGNTSECHRGPGVTGKRLSSFRRDHNRNRFDLFHCSNKLPLFACPTFPYRGNQCNL